MKIHLTWLQPKVNRPAVEQSIEIKQEKLSDDEGEPTVGKKKAKKVFSEEKLKLLREEKVREPVRLRRLFDQINEILSFLIPFSGEWAPK